jgi:hypothetical protein
VKKWKWRLPSVPRNSKFSHPDPLQCLIWAWARPLPRVRRPMRTPCLDSNGNWVWVGIVTVRASFRGRSLYEESSRIWDRPLLDRGLDSLPAVQIGSAPMLCKVPWSVIRRKKACSEYRLTPRTLIAQRSREAIAMKPSLLKPYPPLCIWLPYSLMVIKMGTAAGAHVYVTNNSDLNDWRSLW